LSGGRRIGDDGGYQGVTILRPGAVDESDGSGGEGAPRGRLDAATRRRRYPDDRLQRVQARRQIGVVGPQRVGVPPRSNRGYGAVITVVDCPAVG
jgi:hypothetical protein